MKAVDLTGILVDAPQNCWLALNDEQTAIVGRGETIKEAVDEARKAGVDDPIVMWSPKSWTPRVLEG